MAGCASCGAEPARPDARFCDSCGASLAALPHAEFKPVTVLFADVVRSMDIAAAVGPERLREIMAELVGRSATVVQRYGGTMDKFTGDGIMAVFGAPVTLEDHAVRAALAALGIQAETGDMARTVSDSDGVELRLRVGLNSGRVIAGEIGSGAGGYTAIGEQVGLAQRMESVAGPGTVMVSESTARLLAGAAVLGEPQLVEFKGATAPVPARSLLEIRTGQTMSVGDLRLVGRSWELGAVEGILDRTIGGRGGVVGVVGSPGIGKSRLAREAAAAAGHHGISVVWTYCESHTSDVPFRVIGQLLTAATGIGGLESAEARARIASSFADADTADVELIEDLLGVRDPASPAPAVAADARRRRVTSTIKAATVANTNPVLYIVEDVQWIDEVSESMLAEFFAVVAQTPTMVLVTYRPEYTGALSRIPGMATIAVAPLGDSDIDALLGELIGRDPSTTELAGAVVARVDGNPFFAEEIVRDLAERGVLVGLRGDYTCASVVNEVEVPVTLQATIGARIDRLPPAAKSTLSAAAVVGSRFDVDLLEGLGVEPVLDELVRAELIDQVRFTPPAQYVFRHPLIRTVAYEAQLKADRVATHRRLAAAIQAAHPDSLDENAALIAEHLEAAGDAVEAYGWHMRAGAWSFSRDSTAAQASWERASTVADRLPDTDERRAGMRIAPRTLLCASVWRGSPKPVAGRFEELRELCEASGDDASLAVGMYGLVAEHMFYGRMRQSFAAAAELIALLDRLADLDSSIGVAFLAIGATSEAGDYRTVLRLADKVIDWAGGDPARGSLITGSPLAIALLWRATARWSLGLGGWRDDLRDATRMARAADAGTFAMVVGVKNATATQGVLIVDDDTAHEIDEAVRGARSVGDDTALGSALFGGGTALMLHPDEAVRTRGREMMDEFRRMCTDGRFFASELPAIESDIARGMARLGDREAALPILRRTVNTLFDIGQAVNTVIATGNLVVTLVELGGPDHLAEAQRAVDRMATVPADEPFVVRDISVLRLRALLAGARGDGEHPELVEAYRTMAESLGFEGHLAWAREMASDE